MRTPAGLLLFLGVACSPRPPVPSLQLEGALSTEGGIDIWWTDPGTAPGEEQDTELDDALADLIDAATTTVDLALYEFDLDLVQDAVLDAWDRGVDVRMVGDGDEVHDAGYEALDAAGIPIEMRPAGNRIMHHKFAVVDGQAVWTGSTNVSHNGLNRNDNHSIIVRSEDMAYAYTWEFEEMFGGEFGRGKTAAPGSRQISLTDGHLQWHFSPTHDPIDVVVDAIDSANETVAFMVFSFTRTDVVDALVRAQDRGVTVAGIFDESQANGAWSVDEDLALAGVPVYIDGNENASGFSGGKLHHKVLVVDAGTADAAVISGSMNWSNAGTDDNDENLVWVESPSVADPMMDAFCGLLDIATVHPDYSGSPPTLCEATEEDDENTAARVVINEVYVADAGGRGVAEAFVELVLVDNEKADLTGWSLTDPSGTPLHTFTSGAVTRTEALVLTGPEASPCMGRCLAAEEPLRFAGLGTVQLVDDTGAVVDSFSLASAVPGTSLARVFDGDASMAPVLHDRLTADGRSVSRGQRVDGRHFAQPAAADVFQINEFLPNPDGEDVGAEFVELVNAGASPLDTEDYTLCDASGVCHTFGPSVLLPGQALVLFDQGDHPEVDGVVLSDEGRLSLNNSGDTLTLTDPEGEVHEVVSWTSSTSGVSWNRTTDADPSADWVRHDDAQGATGDHSPGTRIDGTPWSMGLNDE